MSRGDREIAVHALSDSSRVISGLSAVRLLCESARIAAVVTGIQDMAWQVEADVVVVGSGATGLPAAIVAREAGASVIVVEAEPDIGRHAITSGGNVPLSGGNSAQRAHGNQPQRSGQLPEREKHRLESKQLAERGDGRDRRWQKWRRPHLGEIRRRRLRPREVGARAAAR
jgi:glycine/D-amino acid oxidase-like deaminating enzyme